MWLKFYSTIKSEMDQYKIPQQTRIGHVHLKVSNIDKSLDFYVGILGFDIMERMGNQAAFISAGGYHHHIGLNTWHSRDMPPASKRSVGLYHTAILYPTRRDLALIYQRLIEQGYPITGAADHGVSEAIYLDDPDGNGVELYRDRPQSEWPRSATGDLQMTTKALDLVNLLREI